MGGMGGIRLGPGRPLLPGSARPWGGLVVSGCAVLVAVLGVLFAHQGSAGSFDHAVDAPLIGWLGHYPGALPWLALPGSLIGATVLSAVTVVACLAAGRLNGAVLAVVTVPCSVGLAEGLFKPLVHRTYLGVLTYPSGHATAVFAVAAAVTLVAAGPARPHIAGWSRSLRVTAVAVAWLLGVVVAIAVIGLRWHYLTDTIAGAALGVGTVWALAFILDLAAVRRWLAALTRQQRAAARARDKQTESALPGP